MSQSRRDFLRRMGIGLGSGAMLSAIDHFSLTSAMAQGNGYRAMVCVFLGGGNDGNNTIIPITDFALYQSARSAAGTYPNGIYYTQAQLAATNITPATVSRTYALHPALAPLLPLWNLGRMAWVCNAGPLIRPFGANPRAGYLANPNLRPPQLFSHSDQVQQWQTAVSNAGAQTGWGGRTADQFLPHGSGFPMITSIAGSARFTIGVQRRPLTIPTANQPPAAPNLGTVLVLNGFSGDPQGPSRRLAMDYLRTIDNGPRLREVASTAMDQANSVAQALATADVNLSSPFPNTGLGNQMLQVARVIKANLTQPVLGLTHQIFFVSIGGFDTHSNQPGGQNGLLAQVSNALLAFYNWTTSDPVLGDISPRVTSFTLSDFGRTMNPAAAGAGAGSDHAWGNQALVLGGSVRGRDFYGNRVFNNTPYPDLRMGGAGTMDTDSRGRWVPTTSVDQYANTLAAWFGLPQDDATLDAVFPLLRSGGFNPRNLGFMNPLP